VEDMPTAQTIPLPTDANWIEVILTII
jgi:hypothetical protein